MDDATSSGTQSPTTSIRSTDTTEKDYILELSDPPIYFEHITGATNVFYEKDNQQIFCVRSNGVGGVIVKGPKAEHNLTFRIQDKGSVMSIKFSPNVQILGIIRQEKSVEFINFRNGQPDVGEYVQQFRIQQQQAQPQAPAVKYDFYWINNTELLFVCDQNFEHYQIQPEKRQLKLLKTFQIQTNWIIWSRDMQLFIASTSHFGTIINPFVYYKAQFQKLPKFEVDLPLPPNRLHLYYTQVSNTHTRLNESDVVVGCVYNEHYVMVIRQLLPPHTPLPKTQSNNRISTAYSEIVMYKLNTESPAKKTHILRIQLNGRFVLSVVDDLLIVHHQITHSSLLYDIKINGYSDGYVTYHKPIIKNAQIKSYEIPVSHLTSLGLMDSSASSANNPNGSGSASPTSLNKNTSYQMDIYSKNWIMFLPNVIIDTKLCCFWFLRLSFNNINTINELYDLKQQPLATSDVNETLSIDEKKFLLIEFLLNRKNSKKLLLNLCYDMIYKRAKLKNVGFLFDKINAFYRIIRAQYLQQINNPTTINLTNPTQLQVNSIFTLSTQPANIQSLTASQLPVIEQFDMYNEILHPLYEDDQWWNLNIKYSLAILIEYFRSLNENLIPIEHFLYQLLINALIKSNRLYQLHQYLQYHVLNDSKPLACFLLSLQNTYPASMQLALDMLKRLGTANEEIIEILLTKGYIISAIRYAHSNGLCDLLNSKRFLDYAKNLNDKFIYYAVFKYFEERNLKLYNTPLFTNESEQFDDVYTKHFLELFQNQSMSNDANFV